MALTLHPPGRFRVHSGPTRTVTARLERIKRLTYDLARANGRVTPTTYALGNLINREVDAVRRALRMR